ncbi:hypothetical protein ACQY0O_005983 [Thecaphora frezii]
MDEDKGPGPTADGTNAVGGQSDEDNKINNNKDNEEDEDKDTNSHCHITGRFGSDSN